MTKVLSLNDEEQLLIITALDLLELHNDPEKSEPEDLQETLQDVAAIKALREKVES